MRVDLRDSLYHSLVARGLEIYIGDTLTGGLLLLHLVSKLIIQILPFAESDECLHSCSLSEGGFE